MSYKISAFSFSHSVNSMQTRGLQLMNKYINFHTCKSMIDYDISICNSNVCDGVVPKSIEQFDNDLNDADILIFAIAESTGHYACGLKNVMDWLVVKSQYNNSLGTSYGFSNKPIFIITFTPSYEAGNRHFDMTKHLLQDKMGGNIIECFVKNDCWRYLVPDNKNFVKTECNYILDYANTWTRLEKIEQKKYADVNQWLERYTEWNNKWKI